MDMMICDSPQREKNREFFFIIRQSCEPYYTLAWYFQSLKKMNASKILSKCSKYMKTILYYISYHIASTLVHGHCVDKENPVIHKLCVSFRANPYLGGSHTHMDTQSSF